MLPFHRTAYVLCFPVRTCMACINMRMDILPPLSFHTIWHEWACALFYHVCIYRWLDACTFVRACTYECTIHAYIQTHILTLKSKHTCILNYACMNCFSVLRILTCSMHARKYTHMYVYINHLCTYGMYAQRTLIFMWIIHTCINNYIHEYIYICINIYIWYMHIYMHKHTCVCVYICIYTNMFYIYMYW